LTLSVTRSYIHIRTNMRALSSTFTHGSKAIRSIARPALTPLSALPSSASLPATATLASPSPSIPLTLARSAVTGSTGKAVPNSKHPPISSKSSVVGEHISHNLDLAEASIGQTIEIPYESTFGESEHTMWQSTFVGHDRLYTSTPYAQILHLPTHVLPFSMMLFKAISMSHVDETREVLDVGYGNAVYIRPAYAGDTLRQVFTIKELKNTSNGLNTIVVVGCELFNQRNQLIFSVDKSMLFMDISQPRSRLSVPPSKQPEKPRSHLLSHILYNSDNLPTTSNLASLREGQLLLHAVSRPIGKSTNMTLSTLFRWTHPSIYNSMRYKEDEIVVPGGLILAGTLAASSRGLFETLCESLDSCIFLNKVSPVDLIGAISYIQSITQIKEGMEEVKIVTLGLKNVDVPRELASVSLPRELFTEKLHRKQMEQLCADYVPILSEKVVVKAERTIVRQSPFAQARSIPLL